MPNMNNTNVQHFHKDRIQLHAESRTLRRLGRGNLVLRHSFLHFLRILEALRIECRLLDTRAKKLKYKFK